MQTLEADVVVVGAGFAGLTAAVRAQELGAGVVLLEKSDSAPGWSNSRMSGARYHVVGGHPEAAPDQIVAKIEQQTGGQTSHALTVAWAANCRRAYHWARGQGIRFVTLRHVPVMAPVRPNRRGDVWRGRGADVAARRLLNSFIERGGRYRPGTTAHDLKVERGKALRLVARAGDSDLTFSAAGIILADGGFQANTTLLKELAGISHPEKVVQRGAATGSGDGLRMAVSAGATLVNGEALYAHLIHRDAFERPDLCHYPMLDTLSGGSILVGADGHRPFHESIGGLPLANRVARLEDPAGTWLIFDLNGWETAGRLNQIVPPNPTLVLAGARIESAQRPAELAQKTGLPQEALTETLAPAGLNPPLFAIPIAVGLTFTMGGPLVDEHARVLDADRHPITGLYAAGCAIGGLSGGPRPGYAGGISVAFTLGLLAAEHATSRVTTGVVTGN